MNANPSRHGARVIILFLALLGTSVNAARAGDFVPRQVLVKFKTPTSLTQAKSLLDGTNFEVQRASYAPLDIYLVKVVAAGLSELAAVDTLHMKSFVERAYPNRYLEPYFVPNDVLFSAQWNLNQPFESGDIDAPEAWDIATGVENLNGTLPVVAIIEQFYNRDHSELLGHEWINMAEDTGSTNVDDDGNGAIDDARGFRLYGEHELMYENDGDSIFCPSYDDEPTHGDARHGTAVAGLVTCGSNNDTLIAAVNWGCKLLLISTCVYTFDKFDSAFTYIRNTKDLWNSTNGQYGANIVAVNMSFGDAYTGCEDSPFNEIIEDLGTYGIISVNAGPDFYWDVDTHPATPTDCISQYLTTVTASSAQDHAFSPLSCWGDTAVDLYAPGINLTMLDYTGDTLRDSGTSGACPHVSATFALLHSVPNPSFHDFYAQHSNLAALAVKDIILSTVDQNESYSVNQPVVSGGRLNLATAVHAMCNYYHDNEHLFQSIVRTATSPSGTPNFAQGRGDHSVYFDGTDLMYSWKSCETKIYKLSSDAYSGSDPSIVAAEEGDAGEVYMAWLGGPNGVSVLQHKISGDCYPHSQYEEEWRLAAFDSLVNGGPNAVLRTPVVLKETGTIPVIFVAVSGGSHPGVHYWRAPSESWHDFQSWSHGVVPFSDGDNITSVSAYVWEDGDELDQIHVAWTTDEDEVHFLKGTQSGSTYTWDNSSHDIISSGLSNAEDFKNVTYCYSLDLDGGFCAWEGRNTITNRAWIYLAHGNRESGEVDWRAPYSLTGNPYDCINRRAPQLHPYKDTEYDVPSGRCRVGLIYERQHVQADFAQIECRGLRINENNPNNDSLWVWSPPINRLLGKQPTIIEWGSVGYALFYTEDRANGPYRFVKDNVLLTYDIPPPQLLEEDTVTSDQTWYAPLSLDRSIRIVSGGSLRILQLPDCEDDPTTVSFGGSAQIIVETGGALAFEGDSQTSIEIAAKDSNLTWSGIKVEEGGSLNLSYVEMYDCSTNCIVTDRAAAFSIDRCILDGSKAAPGYAAIFVIQGDQSIHISNSTIQNVPNGMGLWMQHCDLDMYATQVLNCGVNNSFFNAVTGTVTKCTFRGRTSNGGVLVWGSPSTLNFTCCTFENIAAASGSFVQTINCSIGAGPTFGLDSLNDASNVINDSCAALMKFISYSVTPIINSVNVGGSPSGHNDWIQRNGNGVFLTKTGLTKTFPADSQYWERAVVEKIPDTTKFSPTAPSAYSFATYDTVAYGLCGAGMFRLGGDPSRREVSGELDDVESDLDSLFGIAVKREANGEYEAAQSLFHQIATTAASSDLRWQATTHVVSSQRSLDGEVGDGWIPALINTSIQADNSEYDAYVYGHRLVGNYWTDRQDYDAAIDVLTNLLTYGLTPGDSIMVAMDLVHLQMVQYGGGGSLDAGSGQIPGHLRVSSVAAAVQRERELIQAYGQLDNTEEAAPVSIPTSYKLYQNYPNPFNPSTEIVFDLPEQASVKLKVYNTLGQLVTTLIDAPRTAGHYTVKWDASQLASGLYLYRIEANRFIDTKKMILIR